MIWFLLLLVVGTGILVDSFRLFLLGLLVMAIKACPRTMLSLLGAVICWAIKMNLRR